MNKITKAVLGAALAVPMALGANVVGAQAAEAATYTTYTYNKCLGGNLYYYYTVRVDYNFWEELGGKRDYTYSYWGALIRANAPACGYIYV